MSFRKVILLLLLLLLLPFALKVKGHDFGKGQSLFSDIKAHKVGDIVTVLVYEVSQATQQVETKTEKNGVTSTKGGPGIGPFLKLFPAFSLDAETKNTHDGKGQNLRNGSFCPVHPGTAVRRKPQIAAATKPKSISWPCQYIAGMASTGQSSGRK